MKVKYVPQWRFLKVPNALLVTTTSHLTLMMHLIGQTRSSWPLIGQDAGECFQNNCNDNDVWEDLNTVH